MSEDTARAAGKKVSTGLPIGRLIVIAAITAVLFAGGLVPLERIPEIPVDIDQKPFFIPYVLVALLPFGAPTLAVGLGAALGEGVLDVLEGYELDDPFGFVGYVIGFFVFGYVLHNGEIRRANTTWLWPLWSVHSSRRHLRQPLCSSSKAKRSKLHSLAGLATR